ncbi:winged helix-turn-helix transcriptional regulator [Qipengyuania sp. NPDC077563]|uniref:winged helix-turn-helix transcriptional regulator n=1 Tax=Qipengyuania sp. NPDC077563 TaxID=3364497 RepID=UPI00384E3013
MKLQKETRGRSKSDVAGHGRWYGDACGTAFGMELVGERWSLLVVRELMFGARRFSDLRASLPGISAKVLTERLETLEAAGVLAKRKLPPPHSAQVYELTRWGYAAEPMIQEIGRWAAMSPQHDPTLPLSPVSFLLSLRTMFDPARAQGQSMRIGFRFPDAEFVAELNHGTLPVARAAPERCDAIFTAPAAPALAAMFYGGVRADEVGVTMEGNADAAQRFIDIFELPEKIS